MEIFRPMYETADVRELFRKMQVGTVARRGLAGREHTLFSVTVTPPRKGLIFDRFRW